MATNHFMDKLRIFLGISQDPPKNDFRNPIWSSDDEDDGDELYTRQPMDMPDMPDMPDYNDALDMQQEFAQQIHDMFKSFGNMFGDIKSLLHDSPFESFTNVAPVPPEFGHPEHFTGGNIRDYYLKPGYHSRTQEHVKGDIDLDGKITSNEISGLLKKKKDSQFANPLVPFNGNLVPGRSFCQTIITTSVTKQDGTVETRRIVKNGNEVIEETITSTSTGTDMRMPHLPGLDQISSPGHIYQHVMAELSSLFKNFH